MNKEKSFLKTSLIKKYVTQNSMVFDIHTIKLIFITPIKIVNAVSSIKNNIDYYWVDFQPQYTTTD